MTNRDQNNIVMKAITKAIDNGWDPVVLTNDDEGVFEMRMSESKDLESRIQFKHNLLASMLISRGNLFSHTFAKFFFGDEAAGVSVIECLSPDDFDSEAWLKEIDKAAFYYTGKESLAYHEIKRSWQHHLQQMVISEDPIQYLAKFI